MMRDKEWALVGAPHMTLIAATQTALPPAAMAVAERLKAISDVPNAEIAGFQISKIASKAKLVF